MRIRVTLMTENDKEPYLPKEDMEAAAKEAWELWLTLVNASGESRAIVEKCELISDGPKIEPYDELMESKRDGFFECNMKSCTYNVSSKCTNPCYIDCPFHSLRQSLRELVHKYEEIVTKI